MSVDSYYEACTYLCFFIRQKLFETLGFTYVHGQDSMPVLQPPNTDKSTEAGRLNLARLLRAWVEIGAIILDLRRCHRESSSFTLS